MIGIIATVLLIMLAGAMCALGWIEFELSQIDEQSRLARRCSRLLTISFIGMFICMFIIR